MEVKSREEAIAALKLKGVENPTAYQIAVMICFGRVAEPRKSEVG